MSYESIKRRYDTLFSRPNIGNIIADALQNKGVEFSDIKQPYFVANDCELQFLDVYREETLDQYEVGDESCILFKAA